MNKHLTSIIFISFLEDSVAANTHKWASSFSCSLRAFEWTSRNIVCTNGELLCLQIYFNLFKRGHATANRKSWCVPLVSARYHANQATIWKVLRCVSAGQPGLFLIVSCYIKVFLFRLLIYLLHDMCAWPRPKIDQYFMSLHKFDFAPTLKQI